MKKVSIGVPVYKAEKYIERCASSLFEQTYKNVEYIFVNDCSPDNSLIVLYDTLKRYPEREKDVKIINNERNRGQAAARNTILCACTGDFILWVDADDWIEHDTISKLINTQVQGDNDIVFFDYNVIYPSKKIYTKNLEYVNGLDAAKSIIYNGNSFIWGAFIRLELIRNNNIRCIEGANMGEDLLLITRISFYANKVTTLHEPLYNYDCTNIHATTYISNLNKELERQARVNKTALISFFKDKGPEFVEAIEISKSLEVIGRLIAWNDVTENDIDFIRKHRPSQRFAVVKQQKVFYYLPWRWLMYLYSILYRIGKRIERRTK